MSLLYIQYDLVDEGVVNMARKIYQKVSEENTPSKSLVIAYYLIEMEHSMGYVGDITPMGTQDGFIGSVKMIVKVCDFGDAWLQNDIRPSATKIIRDFLEEYNHPMGCIRITSVSNNPYEIKINGVAVRALGGRETFEFWVAPGYCHIEAVQKSGYVFSPTVNRRDVNISDGEVIEMKIGY